MVAREGSRPKNVDTFVIIMDGLDEIKSRASILMAEIVRALAWNMHKIIFDISLCFDLSKINKKLLAN